MDTLDLLEDMLADYDGTLILVSHDRDFIDRLASSTIGLNGRGKAVETPGGWVDFLSQNPGFFDSRYTELSSQTSTSKKGATPRTSLPVAQKKLSYKDQKRLDDIERDLPRFETEQKSLELALNDSTLYTRNPTQFENYTRRLDEVRRLIETMENDWLRIEAEKTALNA